MKSKIVLIILCVVITGNLLGQQTEAKIKLTNPLDRALFIKDNSPIHLSILNQSMKFNAEKLPIFCKIEHQLAKSSKVNLMMRLGSLEYVDYLEGKNSQYILHQKQ